MKRITIFASLLTSLFLSATAVAQEDLTKEITVETDYTPHERKAKKLNLLPAVSKPPKPLATSPTASGRCLPMCLPLLHS